MKKKQLSPFLAFFLIFFFIIVFYSCENKITAPDRIINPPGNLSVIGLDNTITVEFYGNNIEEGFKGYNIYITETPVIVLSNVEPVEYYEDIKPTLLYGAAGCYPDASRKSFISLSRDSSNNSLVNNKVYYVGATAYLVIGKSDYESDITTVVKTVVQAKGSIEIENQQATGKSNDGLLFRLNQRATNINVPDDISSGSISDVFFKLISLDGQIVPVFSTEHNNNWLQDRGFADNITGVVDIPDSGFIAGGTVAVILNHVYFLYILTDDRYIKFRVTSLESVFSSTANDIKVTIEYLY